MELPTIYPAFADMLIFSNDPKIKNTLIALSKGLSHSDFRYDPDSSTLFSKRGSIVLDSDRVENYKRFKTLFGGPQKKLMRKNPVPELWKKMNLDVRTRLIDDFVDRSVPQASEVERRYISTKILIWSETSAFTTEDVVLSNFRIERINKVSFVETSSGYRPVIEKRTLPKTTKNFKKTNPLRTVVEKYVASL